MKDSRMIQLAENLINYSCSVKKGDKVLIEAYDVEEVFVAELVKQTYLAGGVPFVTIKQNTVNRSLYMDCTEEQLKLMARYEAERMSGMDAYIGVRGGVKFSRIVRCTFRQDGLISKFLWQKV